MDQNGGSCQVHNDAGVLVPVEQALAERIALEYFPNCGGHGCSLPLATDEDVAWLLNLCRQDSVTDVGDYEKAVNLLKHCSEHQLDCEILAPLQAEGLLIAKGSEQHTNIVVRMIAQICLMCAAEHYMG